EPRFVPAASSRSGSGGKGKGEDGDEDEEDNGYLLFYAFDESQLDADGEVPADDSAERRARSELWILDARDMQTVVAKVQLPQRVPYGLHGGWFSAGQIEGQRAVGGVRGLAGVVGQREVGGFWGAARRGVERMLG
ncbi:hypothetical protein LTR53_019604, partial [Teratosphaeriaceae sp. CCFEE 6253]